MRYAETDQMGIVHHASYVVWLEEGRSQWLRAHGTSFVDFEGEGVSLAVSNLDVRYCQAARYDQLIKIRCWIEAVKSRQITFRYEVCDATSGNLLAQARTEHICVNRAGQVTKIPEGWRDFLRQKAVLSG